MGLTLAEGQGWHPGMDVGLGALYPVWNTGLSLECTDSMLKINESWALLGLHLSERALCLR